MSESRSHKTTSNRIARRLRTEYNSGKGVDIKASRATIEVETPGTVQDAPRQLRGHRGPVYIAGTNSEAIAKALKIARGTTMGVMNNRGEVVRRSTRKR